MGHSVQRPSKTQSHAGLAPQQLEASSQTSPEKAGAGATTGRALARHDKCRVDARILVACYDLVVANKHYTQQHIQLEVTLHVSLTPMLTALSYSFTVHQTQSSQRFQSPSSSAASP